MKQRVVTAVLLIVPVLAALFARAEWPFELLAAVTYLLGLLEVGRIVARPTGLLVESAASLFGIVPLLIWRDGGFSAGPKGVAILLVVWTAFGVLSTWLSCRAQSLKFFGVFSYCWLAGPLFALLLLHQTAAGSGTWQFANPTLLAMVPLWAGDTAAIFAGRAFGKHPMAPAISPKKTWEGGFANLLACIAAAVLVSVWIGKTWQIGLACGLAAGALGQAGDLFESYVKRQAGVKDSGTLLPGHGGLMDRIDSILFTAPAVALILAFT